MEDKIEREERPLLNNKIQELETTLTTKANQSYNNQIKVLHAEVQNNYELQISKIVDDVIHRHQQTIDDKKAELQQLMDILLFNNGRSSRSILSSMSLRALSARDCLSCSNCSSNC